MNQKPAKDMTDLDIARELDVLDTQVDELRSDLEESGGMSGSPGEWIYERMDELETEMRRRRQAGGAK